MQYRLFEISQTKLILAAALFFTAFHNFAFFRNITDSLAFGLNDAPILASLALLLFCAMVILLSILGTGRVLKGFLITLFLVSSLTAYFMDSYNVVINSDMITNVVETDVAEAGDLFSARLVFYVGILGLLPGYLVYRTRVIEASIGRTVLGRAGLISASVLTATILVFASSNFYASFIREHKTLRYYSNPTTPIYSLIKYAKTHLKPKKQQAVAAVGLDAHIPAEDHERELVVFIVGETARADHFSLNGYARETNPLLARENVISFTNVHSCGTSTAASVPCMFSILDQDHYSPSDASAMENLLDVLTHADVSVLWRDNNSDSKGVAERISYEDFRSNDRNPECDTECRDTGMLSGLDDWVDQQTSRDILIVLHQKGSHGPTYYKRYPAAFERFKPTCTTNQLSDCSDEAITNTYDNTILYTDFFLSEVIQWLKKKSDRFETAMVYFSDHGESLGESGVYLHGLPYAFAPEAQTHVPAIMWIGESYDGIDIEAVRALRSQPYSHDNIFHTMLGLFEITSTSYDPGRDMLRYTGTEPWRMHQARLHTKTAPES